MEVGTNCKQSWSQREDAMEIPKINPSIFTCNFVNGSFCQVHCLFKHSWSWATQIPMLQAKLLTSSYLKRSIIILTDLCSGGVSLFTVTCPTDVTTCNLFTFTDGKTTIMNVLLQCPLKDSQSLETTGTLTCSWVVSWQRLIYKQVEDIWCRCCLCHCEVMFWMMMQPLLLW